MIKKAQIKFICLTMFVLLIVFALITSLTYVILHNGSLHTINNQLNEIESLYIQNPSLLQQNHLVVYIPNQENFSVLNGYTSFETTEIESLINYATGHTSYHLGAVNKIYYKLSGNYLYAKDMSAILKIQTNTLVSSVITYSIIYLLLFIIVIATSGLIFKPIKESFYKQKRFISNASHELKTPLSIISASAEILKNTDDNKWINNIQSQSKRMNKLIADMLDIAKIDEGSIVLNKENIDLSSEILENILPFESVVFESGKTLLYEIQPNISISGDRESVRKIITILMDNAVKYSNDGGIIKILLKKNDSKIIFSIYNDGSNVKNEESNRIFERFYRAENSRSREYGGSGLGLAIAKAIANANKWKIFAKSEYAKSLKITIIF